METEIWKPVVGYEGLYEVSNLGRVKSLGRKWWLWHWRWFIWRIRKNKINKNWYVQICLSNKPKKQYFYVHRLIAFSFIENMDISKIDINHINWIKTDNRVDNLEWCTKSENQQHRQYVLMKKSNVSWLITYRNSRKRKIIQYDLQWNIVNTFNSILEWIKITWINTIKHCLYWYQKTAGGFIFKFKIYEN